MSAEPQYGFLFRGGLGGGSRRLAEGVRGGPSVRGAAGLLS